MVNQESLRVLKYCGIQKKNIKLSLLLVFSTTCLAIPLSQSHLGNTIAKFKGSEAPSNNNWLTQMAQLPGHH